MTCEVRSERTMIRMLGPGDRDAFVAYRRDPRVARYQSWSPDYSVADADALLADQPRVGLPDAGRWMQLAIVGRNAEPGGQLLGDVAVGLDANQPDTYELGVTIAPAHQGRGYATEAVAAVIDWLMAEHGAHRIVMQGDARNDAVLGLLGRLGLRQEGHVLEGDWFKGEWTTLERFAMLRREWEARARERAPCGDLPPS